MRFQFLGLTTVQIGIAAVLGVFALLAAFFPVSDRLGGWPFGYAISIFIGIAVFVSAIGIVRLAKSRSSESASPFVRARRRKRVIPCDRKGHEGGCDCSVSSEGIALMDLTVWWIDRQGGRHTYRVKAGEKTGRLGEGVLVDAVTAGTVE
jgi:hypothetical protein